MALFGLWNLCIFARKQSGCYVRVSNIVQHRNYSGMNHLAPELVLFGFVMSLCKPTLSCVFRHPLWSGQGPLWAGWSERPGRLAQGFGPPLFGLMEGSSPMRRHSWLLPVSCCLDWCVRWTLSTTAVVQGTWHRSPRALPPAFSMRLPFSWGASLAIFPATCWPVGPFMPTVQQAGLSWALAAFPALSQMPGI